MSRAESFEFECRILHETDAAIKVLIIDTDKELWFPLSAVDEIHREDPARIVVAAWIARAKGLT